MFEFMTDLREALKYAERLQQIEKHNAIRSFKPYQKQLDWLNSQAHEKVLFGCNQGGKSVTGTFEVAMHITGRYPSWWKGTRFDVPVKWWVVGETSSRVRDTLQNKLFGEIGQLGTGWIPMECIDEKQIIRKPGIPYAIDIAQIKHISGGWSTLQFFSYDQGREKFQGSTIDGYLMDEEPPPEVDEEARMRIIVKRGYALYTFTPLKGLTKLYSDLSEREEVYRTVLTVDDVGHLGPEEIERMKVGLSEEQIKARLYGRATHGSLQVFQFDPDEYICEPFEISRHWRRIGGFDVGINHPTTAVAITIDDESGTIYAYREYKKAGSTPVTHAAVLKKWGIEFATDPSAWNRSIATMESAGKLYTEEGMRLHKANNDVNASIQKIRSYIGQGKFFIFSNCTELIKEFQLYRFKESESGKPQIYKLDDDCVDALRYAIMSTDKATISGIRIETPIVTETWKPVSQYGY